MIIKKITTIIIVCGMFVLMQSCESGGGIETFSEEIKESYNGGMESHYMGDNCMNCHNSGGTGEGLFNVAGTVYDTSKVVAYPNTTVRLYTEPNGQGTLKYIFPVDGRGNFYSTKTIDFGSGLYATVQGGQTTQYMPVSVTIGQCSSCHGVTEDKIWAK